MSHRVHATFNLRNEHDASGHDLRGTILSNTLTQGTKTWPELAIGLYDKLTGRGAEITYEFNNMEVWVPSRTGEDSEHAKWRVNGGLTIRTRDTNPNAKE